MANFVFYVKTNETSFADRYDGNPLIKINVEPENVLDRTTMNKLTSCEEVKRKLFEEKGKYVVKGDIFAMDGSRADVCDVWNLINDGAAGVVLETDDHFNVDLALEVYAEWEKDNKK